MEIAWHVQKMKEENAMTSLCRRLTGIVLACLLAGYVAFALQTGQNLNDGLYTNQQAMRGQSLYHNVVRYLMGRILPAADNVTERQN
jgi:hypothetical protein